VNRSRRLRLTDTAELACVSVGTARRVGSATSSQTSLPVVVGSNFNAFNTYYVLRNSQRGVANNPRSCAMRTASVGVAAPMAVKSLASNDSISDGVNRRRLLNSFVV